MILKEKSGVLLVNLGTPKSPKRLDVFRYLIEFLTDYRVIDLPYLPRQLLVRGLIVPKRYKESARAFEKVWTKAGSPLLTYGQKVTSGVQERLGGDYQIELAMRYQEPSIKKAIARLKGVSELIVFPLFPQYASATTGSIHEKVMKEMAKWSTHPHLTFIDQFAIHPAFIEAHCTIGRRYPIETYDQILFSFHGLPERHIRKADPAGVCLKGGCCQTIRSHCYASQCQATMRGICEGLAIPQERATLCFQSRLGRDPWLKPYAADTIDRLRREGKKRLLIFSPAFVADCLETLYEIGVEYREAFLEKGGEALDFVTSLNDEPFWMDALAEMIRAKAVVVKR